MKTCLYNPVFINPLAYFVFPQLYTMLPKTDDLIEYAKYTGQLIVTDVTNNDTYTVYSRSNSIDLSDFAKKRIRISLYTNTGAVLLGEWNIPVGSGSVIHPNLIAAWSAAGKTNEDEDRAVLKDLTGNGHDITLYNVAFSGMSGYGGYVEERPFTSWYVSRMFNGKQTISQYKTNITKLSTIRTYCLNNNLNVSTNKFIESYTETSVTLKSFKLKIDGLKNGNKIKIAGLSQDGMGGNLFFGDIDLNNGIHNIPKQVIEYTDFKVKDTTLFHYPKFTPTIADGSDCNITIELLPEYPDALVLDGVDDYGVCKNMPIMTDHTLIFKYKLILPKVNENFIIGKRFRNLNIEEKGAFNIAIYQNGSGMWIQNYGKSIYGRTYNDGIIYLTKYNFNGDTKIIAGTGVDTKLFSIGTTDFRGNDENSATPNLNRNTNMAFYCAYLFDRSLTEEEIKTFIRKNIDPDYVLPSEQETTE